MLDPLIVTTISIAFGLLFLLGAVHKLTGLDEFRAVLEDYRILPRPLVAALAPLVGGTEAAVGIAWLFVPDKSGAALATLALLSVYAAAIAINLGRGRTHISCGCGFGKAAGAGELLSWWLVGRNLLLAAVASLCLLPAGARSQGFIDYLVLAAAVLTAVLLFAAANQLINNRAAITSWRRQVHRHD